jgi:protein TonB
MTTTALSAAMPAAPAWPHALPPGALGGGHPRWAVVAIVALHAVAGWALWHSKAVQHVVADAAPLFVQIISTTATPAALPTPPSPPVATPPPPTVLAPPPVVVVAPSAAAAPLAVVAEAAPAPAEAPAPAPPVAAPAPSIAAPTAAAAPAPATGPRTLPPSAVQYLVPPQLDYPRASRRLRETGRATVRVLIDEAGLPAQVELARSTGFALLDQAALAAVRAARFKPYTENGRPQAGWALIPLSFDLDS